jgi:S-adenosylmethionine hydrolase
MPPHLITLLTDFGTQDAYVAIIKGVILRIDPTAQIIDITHAVPPGDVRVAAFLLRSAVRFFPRGAIHVVIVDPGVGSKRRPILIETDGAIFVGPDNGVLAPAADVLYRQTIRHIQNRAYFLHPVSQTFHGRDIFAPVAAHLARGVAPAEIGPAVDAPVELAFPAAHCDQSGITGQVMYVDHFGNLITNIETELLVRFPAHGLSVSINQKRVAGPVSAYAAVAEGMPLAIIGSWGVMEIAVRNGSAADMFAAGPGMPVTVVLESRDA